jgi:hypothetical protein
VSAIVYVRGFVQAIDAGRKEKRMIAKEIAE